MEFGEGGLVVVDGNYNGKAGHGVPSVPTGRGLLDGGGFTKPAWHGLPTGAIAVGLAGAATWWAVAAVLFFDYQPRYDAYSYILWARWWVAGDIVELARNSPGTLIRPYLYHASLAAIWFSLPEVLISEHKRLAISAVQVVAFVAVVFRLARAVTPLDRSLPLSVVGWVIATAPQSALLWLHHRLEPSDPDLWGVGSGQLLWSQQMGKYATVIADCPGVPVAGVAYPLLVADAATATGTVAWYLTSPHVALWHLFQALNWDFPTTYISTFNPLVTVPLNAVSLGAAVVGFMTLVRVAPSACARLAREAPVLGIVLSAIAGLWLQTAVTAVETRFGIIPWSALSVAATWGAMQWLERARSGAIDLRPVAFASLATGTLLLVSRMTVASVPAFQQLEAAGCWR